MVKLKNQFKTIYLCLIAFIGLLFLFNNHQVMAMDNLVNEINEEIETNLETNQENILNIQKFCALHEIGHAAVAYELSKIQSEFNLINLKTIELKINNEKNTEGGVNFSFDKSQYGYLFSLSVFFGGPEAEKRSTTPIEDFKYKGDDDEKDIENIAQYIIQRGWFLDDFYFATDSLEVRKNKIKNIAQTKTQEIIDKYEEFLSPLADELLEKQKMTKKDFLLSLQKLINQRNNSQEIVPKDITKTPLQNNIKASSGCGCNIL
ncbi:SVM family protein ['Fragaria x ananassa' phyllody phytoplasma]|uniref:SVM family protein n=1 Tax='Fragaria x ananassa' phyllody phytoplasma TaxID=2358428 RepID=A0ABS5K3V2_9MOLU|nr:SVM family protein ['Fragaria x ananassa' phyllody phytoplasma]MBS2126582.1 SVM family protein ['Fragaria x ananassa' phyllody phytoplasma]